MILNKITRKCVLIDIACPFDTRINEKEQNKIEIYGDLSNEIKKNMEKQRSDNRTSDCRSVGYHQ